MNLFLLLSKLYYLILKMLKPIMVWDLLMRELVNIKNQLII